MHYALPPKWCYVAFINTVSFTQVLCLHLKRFRWNNFFRTKVDINIQFPVTALDMSQYVLSDLPDTRLNGSNLYDLAAVIVHHGTG